MARPKYRGPLHAFYSILTQEGPRQLYRVSYISYNPPSNVIISGYYRGQVLMSSVMECHGVCTSFCKCVILMLCWDLSLSLSPATML